MTQPTGPLTGLRVIEMTGIGPVPYAAMILADLGATVLRIDRPGGYPAPDADLDMSTLGAASIFYRSRPHVQLDTKSPAGQAVMFDLISQADALIEGYRPGTMERLSLGPAPCLARAPALAYVRVTGWGQNGDQSRTAGHDLNYVARAGVLPLFGQADAPPVGLPPLIGDMAGGALFAVIGLLSAVASARATGRGQVVDANIVDGAAHLGTLLTALSAMGLHGAPYGANMLDGGRYFYRTYACADGHVAVGAIEPAFRRMLLDRLDLSADPVFQTGDDAACTARLAQAFRPHPRSHWDAVFADTDGCVTPVLSPAEAAADPRNADRVLHLDGVDQPAPAPRFSATPAAVSLPARKAAVSCPDALADWGVSDETRQRLIKDGVLR